MLTVNLPTAARSSGNARSTARVSGGARHHVPFGERLRPEETIVGGPEQMAADPEEILHDAVDRREALELPRGREAAHLPFALLRRFVRDLSSVVGVRVRAMDDRGHHRAAGGSIAGQLVGDQPSRGTALPLQQLAEEADRRSAIPPGLDEDVDHVAVLVHGSPQVLLLAPKPDEHLVQMPGVTLAAAPGPQAPAVFEPERRTPLPDRLVGDGDPALGQQILDVAETEAEPVVQPDRVTDDVRRESVSSLARHAVTLPDQSGS